LKRRNSFEIIADILIIAKNGAKKTKIVYEGNLNFKLVNEYLRDLRKKGLIRKVGRKFKTTTKGLDYLIWFSKGVM